MLHQNSLHHINKRLQQLMENTRLFGGLIVVLVGDSAQLPPVLGTCLWSQVRSRATTDSIAGMQLYFNEFTTVIQLKDNNTLDRSDSDALVFDVFLNRLADGECTIQDWEMVKDKCSKDSMSQDEWIRRGFNDPTTTYLFNTNKEVNLHNLKMLKAHNNPIAKV
jgi:PIF1-like helicase